MLYYLLHSVPIKLPLQPRLGWRPFQTGTLGSMTTSETGQGDPTSVYFILMVDG